MEKVFCNFFGCWVQGFILNLNSWFLNCQFWRKFDYYMRSTLKFLFANLWTRCTSHHHVFSLEAIFGIRIFEKDKNFQLNIEKLGNDFSLFDLLVTWHGLEDFILALLSVSHCYLSTILTLHVRTKQVKSIIIIDIVF